MNEKQPDSRKQDSRENALFAFTPFRFFLAGFIFEPEGREFESLRARQLFRTFANP